MTDTRFDDVRILLTFATGATQYLPPTSKPPINRWYAEWIIANELSSGYYKARRIEKAIITPA